MLFWWKSSKWVEFRGIPPFHQIFNFLGVPRGPGPQKGMEFTCIIKEFAGSAGDRRKCWFYICTIKSRNFTMNYEFTYFFRFWWIFMKWHENHGIGCTPAPGRRNSMYYCTILHDLGGQFRWIPIIFMFFMKSTDFHEMTINHKQCGFHSFSEEFHYLSQKGMRIPVNSFIYIMSYGLGCEGDHFWPRRL